MTTVPRFDSQEVFNQSPPYENVDLFSSDRPLVEAVAANGAGGEVAAFAAYGRQWGAAAMFTRARHANENPPKLYTFDPKGFRRDVVEFHPGLSRSDAGKHRRRPACLDLGVRRRPRAGTRRSGAGGALST